MYFGYITTIKELHKHKSADRLKCATIFGNNVIVDLSYDIGKRVVYFPVDGQLSEEYASDNNLIKKYVPVSELSAEEIGNRPIIKKDEVEMVNMGGYMDDKKRNITALKLRGEKSEGLAMPIETLSKYVDINTLKDGDKITVLNGHEICRKYIPNVPRRNGSGTKRSKKELKEYVEYPFFEKHVDTNQLAYNQNAFKEGDICYITLKMHGTSGRTSNALQVKIKKPNKLMRLLGFKNKETKEYKLVTGTRRMVLDGWDGGFYGSNEFRKKWHDFFEGKIPKNVTLYYEIVGYTHGSQTIMGRCKNKLVKDKEFIKMYGNETVFSYGCAEDENDIYVYRMTMVNEDGFVVEVPFEQMQIFCDKIGVKCVPLFEKFIFTTWEDLMERVEKYYDGVDPIGKTHIREGVVVRRMNAESFSAYKHKNFYFKVLSNIIKDQSEENGILNNIDNDLLEEM